MKKPCHTHIKPPQKPEKTLMVLASCLLLLTGYFTFSAQTARAHGPIIPLLNSGLSGNQVTLQSTTPIQQVSSLAFGHGRAGGDNHMRAEASSWRGGSLQGNGRSEAGNFKTIGSHPSTGPTATAGNYSGCEGSTVVLTGSATNASG